MTSNNFFSKNDRYLLNSLTIIYIAWLIIVLKFDWSYNQFSENALLFILVAQYAFFNSTHSILGFSISHRSEAFLKITSSIKKYHYYLLFIISFSAILIFALQYNYIDLLIKNHAIRFIYFSTLVWHAIKQTQGISLILQKKVCKKRRHYLNTGSVLLILGCILYSDNILYISQNQDLIPPQLEQIGIILLAVSLISNSLFLLQLLIAKEFQSFIFSIRILGYYLFLNPFLGLAMRCLHGLEALIFYNRLAIKTHTNYKDLKKFYFETTLTIFIITLFAFWSYFYNFQNVLYFILTASMVFNFLHFLQETYFYRLSHIRNRPLQVIIQQ